jgi:hypothetical protein
MRFLQIDYNAFVGCWPNPCLFELESDESEHSDIAESEPEVLATMLHRFKVRVQILLVQKDLSC